MPDSSHAFDANSPLDANSPYGRYHQLCQQLALDFDPAQQAALAALQQRFDGLNAGECGCGLYLWGDVGRGKTLLMDLFHASLGTVPSLRLHFHRFMARIHRELNLLSGVRDPLKHLARELAKDCKVLCFDEFFVSDIGDAIILGRLCEALFEQGVLLVATSNTPIPRLYENGLQRERFLPAIALLEQQLESIHLDGGRDHRLRVMAADTPHGPLPRWQQGGEPAFEALFSDTLLSEKREKTLEVQVLGRPIAAVRAGAGRAWFSFNALCEGPRSQLDYMALAEQFDLLVLSDVPRLGGEPRGWIRARGTEDGVEATATGERILSYAPEDDAARRFIALVDEFYDQGKQLYLHTRVPLTELYCQGALSFEFRRTHSRLQQMLRADWPG
ncbi:cell division protein ZapE [Shewanella sedimentimangrovi]|uniref:AFG1 family ATPase n=1 Tax=Shewanella sedimentimangrovi TaxID=2814293 RepID=A0ABX7R583_9GAMM|nr:cell division protein ZapE [Shewanella sedimentimangrovi]QSX37988.1 AFG1 family ATPase [Shewanella sedimentimangrovi]